MVSSVRTPPIPYALALVIVGAATLITALFWGFTYPGLAPLFIIAVAISAWVGGVGPGVTAALASFVAIAGLILAMGDVRTFGGMDVVRVLSLLPVALGIGVLYAGRARAEQALRERDLRLLMVSQQIPGGVWSTDAELRITSGFGAQSALLHGPVGTTLYDHFETADNGFAPIAAHRRALRGESSSFELQWAGRTFQSYVEPLRNQQGDIIGVVGVATDMTDRKYAEEERERLVRALETQHARLNAIVDSIPAGILVAQAPAGRIVMHNAKVEEVLRHGVRECPDVDSYGEAWHCVDADGRPLEAGEYPMAKGLRGETVRNADYVYRRGDGTTGWIRLSGAPVRDSQGEILGSVAIFYDIDETKRAEEEIRRAKQQLEAANHAKDRFLATLSHELRTPLTPVLALAESLQERESLPADVREQVETIRRNVELEARLIDDLLDLTRIARGKLKLNIQEVDANDLVRNAVEICRGDVQRKGIALSVRLDAGRAFVRADAARLQQVFWNLIKNATKFTPAGGRVDVRTSDAGGDRIRFEVTDTGMGIAPEVLPRIFDAFEQGDATITQQFGGLGLGLAITKTLVEAHDGRIEASSDGAGRGARFVVELASVAAGAESQPAPAPAGRSASDAPLKILLVEDHNDTARVLKHLLAESGHLVATAASFESAVERLEGEAVDLVISDIGLPDGSGLDLMKYAAGRYHLRGIALSGYGTEEDVQRSLRAGFAAHLTKPVPISTLRQAIADVAMAGVH